MTFVRLILLLLPLLLAGCERGPDQAQLTRDIQLRLDQSFGEGAFELAWLRRAGSAPGTAAEGRIDTIVYFDTELTVGQNYDPAAWDQPGLAALAALMGATETGINTRPAAAADGPRRLQLHGSLSYHFEDGIWTVSGSLLDDRPGFVPGVRPGTTARLAERISAVLAESERDAAGPARQIVSYEFEAALGTIERRLERARSVYGIASGPAPGEYWRLGRAYARFAGSRELSMSNLATGGSFENVRLLIAGEADFALVQSDIAALAFEEQASFEHEEPAVELRALASLYPEPVHLVVMSEAGIGGVADLAGRRVDLGPFGSGSRNNARAVLAAHGLAIEDLERVSQSPPAEALRALSRGDIDAVFMTIGAPARLLATFLARNDAQLVPLDTEAAARIAADVPGLVSFDIPTFSYPRQPAPVPTVAATALLVATNTMPDGEVATVLEWTFDEMDFVDLGSLLGSRISRATARAGIAIPLHDGAAVFFNGSKSPTSGGEDAIVPDGE